MIVRLKGVKRVRSKGKTYYYHRRSMTRLPGQPGSAEFLTKIRELDRKTVKVSNPGTLGGLISSYRASPEFTNLAASSRINYQLVFDILAPNAGKPLHEITRASLYDLRDQLAAVRGRTVVNRLLTVLRIVFNWGIKREIMRGPSPTIGVDAIRRPKGAKHVNRPWRPEELEAMLAAAGPRLRLAIAMGAYTGLRESDVVRVTWSCYDGQAFETRTQKTGQRVWIPAHRRLREMLDTQKRITVPYTEDRIIGGTASGLRSSFFTVAKRIGMDGLSFHGLRHTLGTALAEAGCTALTIAAVLGHSNSRMAEHYSRHASRDHLAAEAFERLK